MTPLRLLIADDHRMMRQAIIQIIKDEWPDVVCEEVEDGMDLVSSVMQNKFDLVISDLSMPRMNGLEALQASKRHVPDLPVLISSINGGEKYALRALRRGAAGYVPKLQLQRSLIKAIRTALRGKRYVSIELAVRLAASP
ncbi:MAG: response regulator transcription factor [Bacteroidetes bacterium]|nr:response regulator transcription factor [Bacteroidota bacterium]